MWWLTLSLFWWCGTSAVPSPTSSTPSPAQPTDEWICPEINEHPIVECSCDMPHTLRCTGDKKAMQIIGKRLKTLKAISLLDCTIQNVTTLPGPLLKDVALHGLVISSGEIKEIQVSAFEGLATPLQALGLPNNKLSNIPINALKILKQLDRLDLSSNKIKSLDSDSFRNLENLTFLELSDNTISKIGLNTFNELHQLKTLRLRNNRITTQVLYKLQPLEFIEELDLSGNSLLGPLGPKTFPKMSLLKDLQLSHNSFSSIKIHALQGMNNLTTLSLHHNQIDVLEDNAFYNLASLETLDLAHNRIVAISGASLAHLINLIDLDLRHNFLRALTADLILPSLRNLRLDDNDITIVSSDAFTNTTIFKLLTLNDNPLNCDCSLIEFAMWLGNSTLSLEDKSSPVCTTPPSLENGLLLNVSLKDLVCGETEESVGLVMPPVKARINLESFNYDGDTVILKWNVDGATYPYICDAIFIYEEEDSSEVLLESNPLSCNSTNMKNPKSLTISVPHSMNLQQGHRYRYCVVLLESDSESDDLSLVLGCSDVLPLIQNIRLLPKSDFFNKWPRVIAIQANLTHFGVLEINVNVYPVTTCEINVAVLEQGVLLSQKSLNCSEPRYTYVGLDDGPYRVCANVVLHNQNIETLKPRCVTVYKSNVRRFSGLDIAFVTIFLILCFMVIALIFGVRKILLRTKMPTHQCFLPPELDDEQQHNRYVKLQATTKL